ncbi:hypothetical protein QAD02_003923 [Eretmocerus hayati]|uniref:Uncharacterized protein n=1 Tax=Eretmocerus hayati TaxID=131215 RepID=A0ACC2NQS9_9HYME|nr:hypothetical protein QAD02_003923 [Eretmocerus hayati]
MESTRGVTSNSSISSIGYDFNPSFEDSVPAAKAISMQKLLIEAASQTNAENLTLGNEISELLSILKFDTKSLPIDIKEGIEKIKAILKSESLPTVDEMALELCLENKKVENQKREREEKILKAKYSSSYSRCDITRNKLSQIQNEVEQIEDTLQGKISNDENGEMNRLLLSDKLQGYRENIKKLEQELDGMNYQDIGVDKIFQKKSLLMDKMNELSLLDSDLDRYKGLPPNLLQAKKYLECKQKELEGIEALISDKINAVN